jgi:hypothetical protein
MRGEELACGDYQEIVQLYARYNLSSDSGSPDDYAACFTEDGVLEAGDLLATGRAELTDYKRVEQAGRGGMTRRHWNGSLSLARVADGEVRGTCYLIAFSQVGARMELVDSGVYSDRIIRSPDGSWRFAHRYLVFDVPRSASAAQPAPEDGDEARVLRVGVEGFHPSSTFHVADWGHDR